MPRVAKATGAGRPAAAKKAGGGKKSKLYAMPEKLKEGTILTDLTKTQWRIGSSIGIGGFGEIYSACRVGEKNYDAVVKCEPHGNGPLFVEMHFYLRNAKIDDIKQFKKEHGLKSLGMPHILANGSLDVNGNKHRFIVMPRYGSDISKFFIENGKRLPEATVYRIAIQMLDVYQFMHGTGYVHADLKAANILLGLGKEGNAQVYLVDFGLASHFITGEFKPDPKKMHNGTIEYTSRDAHLGVATRRADFEILGYNLIEWLGVELPWVRDKLLNVPLKVQKAKEAFIADVTQALKQLFTQGVPTPIGEYMKYVAKLKHNEAPDYDKCRNIFLTALKQMKVPNMGDLDFKLKPLSNNNSSPGERRGGGSTKPKRRKVVEISHDSSSDVIECSTDEDDNDTSELKKRAKIRSKTFKAKSPLKRLSKQRPVRNQSGVSPRTPLARSPKKRPAISSTKGISSAAKSALSSKEQHSRINNELKSTPTSSSNIIFSPSLSLRSKPGKSVINDGLTFEVKWNVEVNANIVNSKRKKREKTSTMSLSSSVVKTPTDCTTRSEDSSPETRASLRKLNKDNSTSGTPDRSLSVRSARTPTITVRKNRR